MYLIYYAVKLVFVDFITCYDFFKLYDFWAFCKKKIKKLILIIANGLKTLTFLVDLRINVFSPLFCH